MIIIKKFINEILKKFNLKLLKYSTYLKLIDMNKNQYSFDFKFINLIKDKEKIFNTLKYLSESKSQLRQDIFVLNELNYKTNGFFVEFGATNGVNLSNTFLLEKRFGWDGILAEPAINFHKELYLNRNCKIYEHLVWKDSNSKLLFNETDVPELSTIKSFSKSDLNTRKVVKDYFVETISLNDLLIKFNAPKIIDYLSIDTEGSEYDILNNFNFNNYKFRVITCEHNFMNNRELIYKLLVSKGYSRKFSEISEFDDWYVNPSII
jgi:FkbM family methyltransferase